MSVMQRPPTLSPSSPRQHARSWLNEEWEHFEQMPLRTLCLLFLPSLLLIAVDPLLPIAACLMKRWAVSSWTWRDRWASIWVWAKQGACWTAALVGIVILGAAHVWIFPGLIAALQMLWHMAHLPGVLSLSPLDSFSLVARSLLLLPLAPVLALYYERIDPRTRVSLHRVLTPTDQAPHPPTASPPAHPPKREATGQMSPSSPSGEHEPPPSPKRPKTPRSSTTRRRQASPRKTKQMTIEGFLAADQASPPQQSPPSPAQTTAKETKTSPSTTSAEPAINWDDVVE